MIVAVVNIRFPMPVSAEKARAAFLQSAPKYQEAKGLVRKYYILSRDGATGGGVYLWQTEEDAQRVYTPEWEKSMKERYGSVPDVTYYDSSVIVDNLLGEIIDG